VWGSSFSRTRRQTTLLYTQHELTVDESNTDGIMLPPVDPRVLERNPNFDVLYKDLTTRKLNLNGSTRDTKKQRMHDEIRRVST
jgi:hypothetical protein